MGGENAHVSDGGFSGDDRETIGDLHPPRSSKTKVLFCGLEFLEGWNQTRLAVEHAGLSDQIDVVRCDRQDVPREIQDAHVAVPLMTRLDATALQNAGALRMVIQFGVGLEGVDEAACVSLGIVLARIPSEHTGNAASTAEMAVFLTLAAMREVWAMRESVYFSKTLGSPMGATLSGKNVLIIGWGSVGKTVAAMLAPFGCSVSAARRTTWASPAIGSGADALERALAGKHVGGRVTSEDDSDGATDKNTKHESLRAGLENAHVVILACTQTKENVGMVDDAFLNATRDGCVLVNVARGGLFQPDAILRALDGETAEKKKLAYVASDVAWEEPVNPTHPLVRHERAYFTPHVGGVTDVSYRRMGEIVRDVARVVHEKRGLAYLAKHVAKCSPVNVPQLKQTFPGFPFLEGAPPTTLNRD
jgi:phosphoglycerate dehydrogenase-like enzyme